MRARCYRSLTWSLLCVVVVIGVVEHKVKLKVVLKGASERATSDRLMGVNGRERRDQRQSQQEGRAAMQHSDDRLFANFEIYIQQSYPMATLEAHTKHSLRLCSVLSELRQILVFKEAVIAPSSIVWIFEVMPDIFEWCKHYIAEESGEYDSTGRSVMMHVTCNFERSGSWIALLYQCRSQ